MIFAKSGGVLPNPEWVEGAEPDSQAGMTAERSRAARSSGVATMVNATCAGVDLEDSDPVFSRDRDVHPVAHRSSSGLASRLIKITELGCVVNQQKWDR